MVERSLGSVIGQWVYIEKEVPSSEGANITKREINECLLTVGIPEKWSGGVKQGTTGTWHHIVFITCITKQIFI